jgi:hypothetical protein
MHTAWTALARDYPEFAFTERGVDFAYFQARQNVPAKPANSSPVTSAEKPGEVPRDPNTGQFMSTKKVNPLMNPPSPTNPVGGAPPEDEEDDGSPEALYRQMRKHGAQKVKTQTQEWGFSD